MTHEEEIRYAKIIESSSDEEQVKYARDILITRNLKLVISIAKVCKHRWKNVEFEELIQAGNEGLFKAVDLYDWRRGYRFSTYASWWVRQNVERYSADNGRTIRLPVYVYDKVREIGKARKKLDQLLGRYPTEEELAKETGMSVKKIKFLTDVYKDCLSFNAPISDDGDSELVDFIEDKRQSLFEERVENEFTREKLEEVLETLPERERRVLEYRSGLFDGRPWTLEEIGHIFGLTRERIRQIEAKAYRKLRHPMMIRKIKKLL